MNIYFARSIRGKHDGPFWDVNSLIIKTIKDQGCTPALELPIVEGIFGEGQFDSSNDQHIWIRDLAWINDSVAMVAEVSNPSLGVGYEIAYAQFVARIPVLCAWNGKGKISAMIRGSCPVFQYDLPHTLQDEIVKFLAKVALYTKED